MINKSTDAEVRSLIAALASDDEARRESAIARLIIIGGRGVGRLVAAFDASADRRLQACILRALEPAADDRSIRPARLALQAGGDLAVAGVPVLREILVRGTGVSQAEALDALLDVCDDPGSERRVRAAVVEALAAAPRDVQRAVQARPAPAGSAE